MIHEAANLKKMMCQMIIAHATTFRKTFIKNNKKEVDETIRWVLGIGNYAIPFSLACEIAGIDPEWARPLFLRKARKMGLYSGPIYIKEEN